ncbi:hypothetical protein BGZ51_001545 [Haplosporangium sp. Z 767]|nr:hypothetical protein BGZ51_001545 [Haplosporangium sp. Z 767]
MDANRRQRVVKRLPFWKRITHAPEDYLQKIENDIRALDWDTLQEGFSWPLAIGLNILLISVKLGYWLDDPFANVPAVLKQNGSYYSSKSLLPGFATMLSYLQYLLVIVSFLNAIWLFRSKKNYKMLCRNIDDPPSSSNVNMVEIQQNESHWSHKFPGRLLYPYISFFIRGRKPEEHKRQVWEMALWNPSILQRNLFCWYSPAQVLILAGMNSDNFYVFFPLSIMVALQDKEILFGEVYREYNVKFVYPKIFVRKYDKQVSTDTGTDDYEDRSTQFSAIRRSRIPEYPGAHASLSTRSGSTLTTTISDSESDEDEDELDYGEEEQEEEDEEDEEEENDNGSDVGSENDPDVDYDEEGEEPVVPHPTNALEHFEDDY